MKEAAVMVTDACKSFFTVPVLNGFSMTVEKGTIYSLLGPSGCGKTTILKCILGQERLTSGSIQLGVQYNRDVGYMPQDTSLQLELTVLEIFQYYGLLYGLHFSVISERCSKFVELFDIPSSHRLISTLSGGQQRRVSLAVSLFHDPQLIILDEPTVGLDPLLQERAWDYFSQLVKTGDKSIIITTHYVEEAKRSNRVGLLRGGKLLEEENPQVLMDRMNCATMEEAFLKLCYFERDANKQKDEKKERYSIMNQVKNIQFSHMKSSPTIKRGDFFSVKRFLAQLFYNFFKIKRNLWMIVFILMLPLLQSILFNKIYAKISLDLKIGYLSKENKMEGNCSGISNSTEPLHDCYSPHFSLSFLNQIKDNFTVIEYKDLQSGLRDVRSGSIIGILAVSKNFTPAIINRVSLGTWATDMDIDMSVVHVYSDMSAYPITLFTNFYLQNAAVEAVKDTIKPLDLSPELASSPLKITPLFVEDGLASNAEAAAFIVTYALYFGMIYTASVLKEEKHSGVMTRSRVSGLSYLEMITAHLLVQSVILLLQMTMMFIIMYSLSDVLINGSVLLALFIIYLQGMIGAFLGILFSQVFKNAMIMSYMIVGVTLSSILVSGCMWPEEGLWWGLKLTSSFSPVTPGIHSLRAILIRGMGLQSYKVYFGLLSSIGWIVIISAASVCLSRFKKIL